MSDFEDKLNMLLGDPDSMEQIMKLAQSFTSGQTEGADEGGNAQSGSQDGGFGDLGIDMQKLLQFISKTDMGSGSRYSSLLFALKPYLKKERQEKLDRAIRLSKLSRLAKSAVENGLIGEL